MDSKQNEELKPCPFCGGEAEFERTGTNRRSCIVTCTDCGATHEGPDEYDNSGSAWNTRANTVETARPSQSVDELTGNNIPVEQWAEESGLENDLRCHLDMFYDDQSAYRYILMSFRQWLKNNISQSPSIEKQEVRIGKALEEIGRFIEEINHSEEYIGKDLYSNHHIKLELTKIKSLLTDKEQ